MASLLWVKKSEINLEESMLENLEALSSRYDHRKYRESCRFLDTLASILEQGLKQRSRTVYLCVSVRYNSLRIRAYLYSMGLQKIKALVAFMWDLHALTRMVPSGLALQVDSSEPWPYNLFTSGQRVLAVKTSSLGGWDHSVMFTESFINKIEGMVIL